MLRGRQIFVKTWPKPETTREKSLALRVTSSSIFRGLYFVPWKLKYSLDEAEYCVKNCFRQNIYKFPIGSLRKLRNVFLLGIQQNVVGLLRGSNYLSFWNLPSIVSSCTLLKIWIWSLCVSIFVWYNRMPTELQSVCSTETWAGLIGHQFWPWRRLVLIIIFITNFVSSWSAEPLKKTCPAWLLWPLILQGYTVYCSNVYLFWRLFVS